MVLQCAEECRLVDAGGRGELVLEVRRDLRAEDILPKLGRARKTGGREGRKRREMRGPSLILWCLCVFLLVAVIGPSPPWVGMARSHSAHEYEANSSRNLECKDKVFEIWFL